MCPAKRGRGGGGLSKKSYGEGRKGFQQEVPRPSMKYGAGWVLENYQYLKLTPIEKQADEIYKLFKIPLHCKLSEKYIAVHLFTEFQLNSFAFAQQFADNGKALMVLMLFTDYIGNVPSFSNSKESFSSWYEKALKIIQNSEFTPQEQQAIMAYINNEFKSKSHIFHYILTNEELKRLDSEGIQLFRPISPSKKDNEDDDDKNKPDPNAELEAQLAAAALAERGAAEAEQKRIEMKQTIETIVNENLGRIKTFYDSRNETILNSLFNTEDRIVKQAKLNK